MKNKSTQAVKMLWTQLPSRRQSQLAVLALLMLGGGFAEVLSLGLIVPFLAFLIDPLQALQVPVVAQIANIFNLSDPNYLRWQFTLLFTSAAFGAGLFRLILIWATTRIVFGIGYEMGAKVYRRVIYQPYEVHISRNSSEIIGAITKVEPIVFVAETPEPKSQESPPPPLPDWVYSSSLGKYLAGASPVWPLDV